MSSDTYATERDSNKQHSQRHQGESMISRQGGQKFVSDEDIVGRTDWLNREARNRQARFMERDQKEPKFVSDDDIVRRRVA
jgi:hypothetical protein